jgi:hypothetical protein
MPPVARWICLLLMAVALLRAADPAPTVVPSVLAFVEDQEAANVQISGLAARAGAASTATLQLLVSVVDAAVVSAQVTAFDHAAGTATITVLPLADANGSTQVILTLIDPLGVVAGAVVPVTVAAQNDPPRAYFWSPYNMGQVQHYTLNTNASRLVDPDGDVISYTIVSMPQHGQLIGPHGAMSLGNVFTQADIDGFRISYQAAAPGSANDAVGLTVDDGHAPTADGWGRYNLAFFFLDQPSVPGIMLRESLPTVWTEGGDPIAVCSQALVSDQDSPSMNGGRLVARIVIGAAPGDQLSIVTTGYGADDIIVVGGTVSYGGIPFGTVSGGDGSPLIVEFTSNAASDDAAGSLLRALRFTGSGDDPGASLRQVELTVDDGSTGASPPIVLPVEVVPVNDPPVATPPAGLGLVAGSERIVTIPASDPDSAQLQWTLVQAPGFVTAAIADAQHGAIRLVAPAGAHGNGELVLTVSDGLAPAVAVRIPLAVSAPGDPAPHPAGEFPGQLFRGDLLDLDLPFDCSEIPEAVLEFSLSGEVPAGLVLSAGGAQTARVHWVVPGDLAPGHYRFLILATDQATLATGVLPVMVPVRLPPAGGL